MSLIIENLSYTYMPGTPYATQALDQVNLTIKKKEIVGLIGPTGSGKSTLIQHLNGLLKPTSGQIQIDGLILNEAKGEQMRQLRQKVGLVFQFPEEQLFEETVFDDVAFGPRNMGTSEEKIASRVRWALEAVGLNYEEIYRRSPFNLSGGQMRRVAIAGVLAMRPQILILDEPTAGLDPQGRDSLLNQIRYLWRKLSLTVIVVSHHLDELARLANRLIVMHQGKIILDAPPAQVFEQAEILRQIGLGVPLLTDLLSRLQEKGWPVSLAAVTEKEAARQIAEYWLSKQAESA
ncbi:MAG: energy-coupling factor transporter ATPase [Syntrophomonadaceae bacterium]|nr:energy-coupling factor transporter ATPase [Syntrophomonadaceae bacterium]